MNHSYKDRGSFIRSLLSQSSDSDAGDEGAESLDSFDSSLDPPVRVLDKKRIVNLERFEMVIILK